MSLVVLDPLDVPVKIKAVKTCGIAYPIAWSAKLGVTVICITPTKNFSPRRNPGVLFLNSLVFLAASTYFNSVSYANTRDATVATDSGSYSVPVEVEGGEVTAVYWPNGGAMTVSGADIEGTEASGVNSNGDVVNIELDEQPATEDEQYDD